MPDIAPSPGTVWLDGLNGNDANDGLDSTRPVKTAAAALVALLLQDTYRLAYKNMRETIRWTISNLTMLVWGDTTVPSTRGDTIVGGGNPVSWSVGGDGTYSTSLAVAFANIGTVVQDWDTCTRTSWGGVPAHYKRVASFAACVAGVDTYFSDGTTLTLHPSDGNPTGKVVAYTEHRTTGAECNGIDITGDRNYVEAYPALWTEAAGSGSGTNGKGGWGVILRGDTLNRVALYGARDCGYKAAAVVGNTCTVEGANGMQAVLAGFSNQVAQGITANGNAGITIQGGSTADTTSIVTKNLDIHGHSLLWRNNSQPIATAWELGGMACILCHGQGHLINGGLVDHVNFYNDFDQTDVDYVYAGNLASVSTAAKTAGVGHPFVVRHCTFNAVRRLRIQEHIWIDRCKINATIGPDFGGVIESLSGTSGQIITITGTLMVYNGVPAGYGIGLFYVIKDTGMEVYSIGNTYENIYPTNSFQAIAHFTDATSKFYSRQDVVHMVAGNYTITNKGVFHNLTGVIDIGNMYCVGVGAYQAGVSAFSLPATFNSDNSGTGTNQAYTDATASTLFVNPLTTTAQTGADYHLKTTAPASLLLQVLVTPHQTAGPDDVIYSGTEGAYQMAISPSGGAAPRNGKRPRRNVASGESSVGRR